MKHVITILADGFEETEAITFIDLLRRAEIRVTVLGLNSLKVRGSHDITVETDMLLENFDAKYDGIVLPGGMPGTKNLANSQKVKDLVKASFEKKLLCAAICAAPMIFGEIGILDGKSAVCYPGYEGSLHGAIVTQKPVVRDTNIITSRGVGTAIAFALEIISYLKNQKMAENVQEAILY